MTWQAPTFPDFRDYGPMVAQIEADADKHWATRDRYKEFHSRTQSGARWDSAIG